MDLNDYFYFVHVAEKGSFSRAADTLGIPKSRLSRHITQLENRLDAVLIQRTTRQLRITELGELFYQHARAAIDQVELTEAELKRKKNTLSGVVTLSCSVGVAQFAVKELVCRFLIENPLVTVHQQVTNQNVDLIASGVDLSIRGHVDQLPDSSLVQKPLATVEWNLFASPEYPMEESLRDPSQLTNHRTLSLGWQAPSSRWQLENESGETTSIEVEPRLKSEDMSTLKEAAIKGLGVVALPAYICRDELADGRLLRVLPQWHAGRARLSLIMPRRKGVTAPVRALQAFLLGELEGFVATP